ncbi:MAG: type II toxin-antitoxin system Phd/YefM family antitoxin [Candidatus Contendobacter sp.]
MKTIAATQAKNSFGILLDSAQQEPVTLTKQGRAVAVVLSVAEYERLETLEDAYWRERAHAAETGGYAGVDAGVALLRNLLNA